MIAHNNKILIKNKTSNENNAKDKLWNCRKEPYPLNKQCLVYNKISGPTLTSNKAAKQYVRSTGNSFEGR